MEKMRKLKKNKINAFAIVMIVLLSLYSLSIFFTLGWGLITSLKFRTDFGNPNNNVLGLPNMEILQQKGVSLFNNYELVFSKMPLYMRTSYYTIFSDEPVVHYTEPDFFGMLLNTILYAGVGALVMALVPAVVGYMCAKYRFKFSEIVYSTALVIMIIPIVGAYPSELTVLRGLGLYDTWIGNLIQKFNFTGVYFFVYYAFFRGLSDTYQEAAEVDGASQLRILISIMLPLAIKTIGTVFLIQFVSLWNNYQAVLLYMPTHPTLAYGVYYLAYLDGDRDLSNVPARVASCMVLAIPILILFIVFKDKLMGNMSMGGIKE